MDEIKKPFNWHKYHTITNIILIIVILAVGIYLFKNFQEFKLLGHDVCALCRVKTGANCFIPQAYP